MNATFPASGAGPRWSSAVACEDAFGLGEGPVWDSPRRRLLWVDITAGTVHEGRLEGDRVVTTRSRHLDTTVGAVACSEAGDLLVAGEYGMLVLTADGDVRPGPGILPPGSRRRLNDGACDPAGRFLVGSLSRDGAAGGEVLVRVERSGELTVIDDDLTLSNGLAWDRSGTVFYSIDSVPKVVWSRDYDAASGAIGPRREFLRLRDGLPDGLCIDAEDHLWIAVYGAGQIRRYSPQGELAGIVEVSEPRVTCAAFVGEHLDRLLITSTRDETPPEELAAHPDAGRLFLADVGVAGLPTTPWAGP